MGKPISPGFVAPWEVPQDGSASSDKERWYFPPDEPPPKPKRSERRVTRSRDAEPPPLLSPSPQNHSRISTQLNGLLAPRVSSSPENHYSLVPPDDSADTLHERPEYNPLVIHDLRIENRLIYSDVELRTGSLYDLIQSIPATWLAAPKLKESFIPLLRPDSSTTEQKAPTPMELRLVDGFISHLPEIHIIPQKRIPRKPINGALAEYKRTLNLSSEVPSLISRVNLKLANGYEKSNPRIQTTYSILIIAAIINEISQWIIQQLIHAGTISNPAPNLELIVQHCIFGGVLILETHPGEDPQLAFMDVQDRKWMISPGWLLFKFAEGPGGMPFISEKEFQRRRKGVVRKIGGMGGGLEDDE
jgi:hypothetical protein